MKAYIEALLDAGVGKDEIFYNVAKKFSLKVIIDNELRQVIEKRLIQEAGESRPQIVLEPQDYFVFGKVDKRQGIARKNFKLYNKGSGDLIIRNIAVSCPCISVSLIKGSEKSPYFGVEGASGAWQAELKPNESADLEVVLDLNHKGVTEGDLLREIMITSNDPLYPVVSITVKAEVVRGSPGAQAAEGGEFSGKLQGGIRIIGLKASKFKFEPEPIVVKKGERIRLVATSTDVTHGIAISEYKVNLVIPVGKTVSQEFTADKEGRFPTHCSVFCGPGHGKMRGTFIVK
jgi:cytochrome c oxidase subunit 2